MKKMISTISLVLVFLFTGCAKDNLVAYDAQNYKKIKQVTSGKIINLRAVYIKDDGKGAVIGSVVGAVIGSTIGKGNGSTLAGVGGAILGGVIGNKINETNAQELTVLLDDGKKVVVLSKGTALKVGNKVNIISVDNEVSTVYQI